SLLIIGEQLCLPKTNLACKERDHEDRQSDCQRRQRRSQPRLTQINDSEPQEPVAHGRLYLSSRSMSSRNSPSMPLTVDFTFVARALVLISLPSESKSSCASRASRAEIMGAIRFHDERA